MRWTTTVGLLAGLLAISGCVYGYRSVAVSGRYSTSSRPHGSYFCYDCHGYRYFDPYYDWCAEYGFRYRWSQHPQTLALYRERYVRIREVHPEYGRYRYKPGYRSSDRYRQDRDYEVWRDEDSRERSSKRSFERSRRRDRSESNPPRERDTSGKKQRKGDDRKSSSRRGGDLI